MVFGRDRASAADGPHTAQSIALCEYADHLHPRQCFNRSTENPSGSRYLSIQAFQASSILAWLSLIQTGSCLTILSNASGEVGIFARPSSLISLMACWL